VTRWLLQLTGWLPRSQAQGELLNIHGTLSAHVLDWLSRNRHPAGCPTRAWCWPVGAGLCTQWDTHTSPPQVAQPVNCFQSTDLALRAKDHSDLDGRGWKPRAVTGLPAPRRQPELGQGGSLLRAGWGGRLLPGGEDESPLWGRSSRQAGLTHRGGQSPGSQHLLETGMGGEGGKGRGVRVCTWGVCGSQEPTRHPAPVACPGRPRRGPQGPQWMDVESVPGTPGQAPGPARPGRH
jgi:hypothetical protein